LKSHLKEYQIGVKRKGFTSLLILWLALSTLTAIELTRSTKATVPFPSPEPLPVDQAYIRSDGSIDPPTTPIEHKGNLYTLKDDILNCSIIIEKDNVKIDGKGFLMSIPSYGEKGADGQVKTAPPLVDMSDRTNITVRNFSLHHAGTAIRLATSSEITIINNEITQCHWGITVYNSTRCYLTDNTMEDNEHGSYGAKSNDILYNCNQFSDCSEGILAYFSNSLIIGNTFSGCGTAVKYLEYYNLVVGNTFQENTYGISTIRSDNAIHHNNFIDNSRDYHAVGNYSTFFDDGGEGNYWSDYNGSDLNGDGVGDSPYIIEHVYEIADEVFVNQFGKDKYPLMIPLDVSTVTLELPDWASQLLIPSHNDHATETSPTPSSKLYPSQTPTVAPSSTGQEPFPIVPVAVASVSTIVIAGVGLLVYFKKRHAKSGNRA
jgi:parallel beta-helix repeat protein